MSKHTLAETLNISSEEVEKIVKHQSYYDTLREFVSILDGILLTTSECIYSTDKERDMYMYRAKAKKHFLGNISEIGKGASNV